MLPKPVLGLLAILSLIVAVACSGPATPPTLRPTYTPYPTFTPMPPSTPEYPEYVEFANEEYFRGEASDAYERGTEQFEVGEFQAAITSFKEAQRHYGKPSATLENKIALAYYFLQRYSLAIEHFSNSIAIEDNPLDRTNRGWAYVSNFQCDMAIPDAKAALTMEPTTSPGFHTDVEANVTLATCYEYASNYMAALQHIDAAIAIGEEHQYGEAAIIRWTAWRDRIKRATE